MRINLPRYRTWCLILLLIGSALLGFLSTTPLLAVARMQTDDTGRIAGMVTNAEGVPLEGIEVNAYRYDPLPIVDAAWPYPWWRSNDAITDAAGAYQIANLPAGIYTLYFSDPQENFAFEYYGDSVTLSQATTIEVIPAQTTDGIDGMLAVGGVIQGQISMYDGTPVSQIIPRIAGGSGGFSRGSIALLIQDGQWQKAVKQIDFDSWDNHFDLTTSTFTFRGLPLGDYRISYGVIYGGVDYTGGNAYWEFYPNSTTIDQASAVSILPEAMRQQLTIVIGANPTYGRIQGQVTGPDRVPVAGVAVLAFSQDAIVLDNGYDGYTALPDRSALTDAAGYYELPALAASDYRLHFFPNLPSYPTLSDPSWTTSFYAPEYYNNKFLWSATDLIHLIPGTTVADRNVALEVGARLTGQVRMFDGTLINDADNSSRITKPWFFLKHLRLMEKGYPLYPYSPRVSYDKTTGVYLAGGLAPGTYSLEYGLEYEYNGVGYSNWHSTPITIQIPASDPTIADLVVSDLVVPENAKPQDPSPNVLGKITNEAGLPLAGIKVSAAIGCDEGRVCTEPRDVTDGQGSFDLYIQPGTGIHFYLSFSDPNGVYAFENFNDTPLLYRATPIELSEGLIISDINVMLAPASKISGHVTIFDGTPLSQASGMQWLEGQDARGRIILSYYVYDDVQPEGGYWQPMEEIHVLSDTASYRGTIGNLGAQFDMATNRYTFTGLAAGQYRIEVEAVHNGSHYGGSATDKDSTASTREITVTAGTMYDNIDLVLGNDNQRVLALYALALDHDPDNIDNLAPQLAPAMQSIIAATRDQPNKTAVVLADAAGVDDTHIYVVRNGRATPVQGLPNAAFQLDPALTEFNMADGETLGNFIRWARNSYPAEVTLFGFVGHGAPLVPATGFAEIVASSGGIRPLSIDDRTDNLFPLPSRVDAYPSLTDNHPEALITPFDLATALRIGSNNGADPLQIADVAHCFAASIEELYELSPNGDQPYAEIILASPTYTYLDPPALGQALGAVNTLMTPARMADQILQTYDGLIEQADLSDGDADVEHPRLLVAVNSRQVARVKEDWDKVAYQLLQTLDVDKLRQAYQQSPKYDTTLCRPQDWALGPPDALSDLSGFAAALVAVYGAESAVGQAAGVVVQDLGETAILSRYQRNGTPWYASQNAQFWNFDQHKGIALYTDLQGTATTKAATVDLSWQSRWYTADTLGGENPHPYAFVQNGADGVTWADVFAEFWRRQPNVTIQTALCFPELASDPQTGELRAVVITSPVTDTVRVGLPFTPVAVVAVEQATLKPRVRFNLYDATQTLLFSDTVQAGYWLTGTHQIAAARAYIPTAPGTITVEVTVDPTNGFIESDETDNHLAHAYTVAAATNLFPLAITAQLAEPALFVSSDRVQLQAAISPVDLATTLEVQLYQFADNATSAPWQPVLRDVQVLDRDHPELLLNGLSPGVVLLHIWARTADGSYSVTPALVEFNYAPANQLLAAGQRHIYRLPLYRQLSLVNGAAQLNLTLSRGRADLFAWSPFNQWGPEWHLTAPGDTPLILPATTGTDGYLLELYAATETQYTLTAQPTANPPTAVNATDDDSHYWPAGKPLLIEPVSAVPGRGRLVAGRQFFLPLVSR